MVLRLGIVAICALMVACQPIPDYEKESLESSSDSFKNHVSELRIWMWSCRGQPKAKSIADFDWALSRQMDAFLKSFREAGLSLVDIEPSRVFLGSAFLWNREGYLVLGLDPSAELSRIECRGPQGQWIPAAIKSHDKALGFALLQVDLESQSNYENYRIWRAKVEAPRSEEPLTLLASSFPGSIDQQRVWLQAYRSNMQTGLDDDLLFFQPAPDLIFNGGLLMTKDGRVAAYVLRKESSPWGMAIRIGSLAKNVQARIDGTALGRAYFGFRVRFESEKGFVIQSVEQASPARQAGIQAQDVLIEWDGQELENLDDWPKNLLAQVNRPIPFLIQREGEEIRSTITASPLTD